MATTFSAEQTTSSAFRFQHSSPLDALVRHSSAKRARAVVQSTASSQQYPSSLIDEYAAPQSVDEREIDLKLSAAYVTVPNGSQPTFQNSIAPVVATGSFKPRNVNMNVEYQNRNDESIYSRVNSFVQVAPQGFRRPGARPEDYSTSPTGTDRATAVPTVKVSSPGVDAGLRRASGCGQSDHTKLLKTSASIVPIGTIHCLHTTIRDTTSKKYIT